MHEAPGGASSRLAADRERLAARWLARLVASTPLAELERFPLAWLAVEAPSLIAEILRAVEASDDGDPGAARLERHAESLARIRSSPHATARVPTDLAALHQVLVEALTDDAEERGSEWLAVTAGRLAEVFGRLQAVTYTRIADDRAGDGVLDGDTGLQTRRGLERWLRALIAIHERYGHPFAVALVAIDGLEQLENAYGARASGHVVRGVAEVLRRQSRAADQIFRVEGGEFVIVAPDTVSAGLVAMAERTVELLARSQDPAGPRIGLAAGVASCPADGSTVEHLIARAEEALYAALASASPVATRACPREAE